MGRNSYFTVDPLIAIFEEFRALYGDFTVNQLLVLFQIARNPGITSVEVMEKTGLSDASISRICSILSHYGNRGTAALNLIEFQHDPNDRRLRLLSVSAGGEALFSKIILHLEAYSLGARS